MNGWELIFAQSPVNNGYYAEDDLEQRNWDWPRGTWFQARLNCLREHQRFRRIRSSSESTFSNGNPADGFGT
jgi:hypothetical protein